MKLRAQLITLGAVALLAACQSNGSKQATLATKSYKMPEVPMSINSSQDAQEYVLNHAWDQLIASTDTQRDSTHIDGYSADDVEQAFGMYTTLLGMQPLAKAQSVVSEMFSRIEAKELADTTSNVFETLTSLAAKYLYDPNSPVRNEDIYEPFVKRLSTSAAVPESLHAAYAYDAQMCALNVVGSRAADFGFTTLAGRRDHLRDIHADHILLFFSNPGCNACKQIQDDLAASQSIQDQLKSGSLKIVNVYIDEEIDKWREYAVNYPDTWIAGYDDAHIIRGDVIYNVRAIPSLYLLDSNQKVIFKDAPTEQVLQYLSQR